MSTPRTTSGPDMERAAIGRRVRAALDEAYQGNRHDKDVAAAVDMTPDAFSRSLSGDRAFSSLELARIADLISADIHYLITGDPDPLRVVFAARHDYDPETGARDVPGHADDATALNAVQLAYTQARHTVTTEPHTHPATAALELPTDPALIRTQLGAGFVRIFADRLEEVYGIDVVRIQNISTDYCFTLAGKRVIVLRAQSNWFRSNYSLAHELAHLAFGHHDVTSSNDAAEAAANQFAAELLLPTDEMRAINWATIDPAQLARKIWDWGVSTSTVSIRLNTLRLNPSTQVVAALNQPTQRLLRAHPESTGEPRPVVALTVENFFAASVDPISNRMRDAAERRIPANLIKAHLDGIAAGRLAKGTLSWLLETPVESLDIDEPEPPTQPTVDELAAMLGLSPA